MIFVLKAKRHDNCKRKDMLHNQLISKGAFFASGILLLFFSLPNQIFHFWFLAWFCLIPNILLGRALTFKKRLALNFLYFFIAIAALLWLDIRILVSSFRGYDSVIILVIFFIIVSFGYASVMAIGSSFIKRTNSLLIPSFLLAALWAAFEYLLMLSPLLPISIALTQYDFPEIIQNVPYYGIYGISFLIVFTNSILALSIRVISNRPKFLIPIIILIILHSANLCYGIIKINYYDRETNKSSLNVALIQPSFHWTTYGPSKISNIYLKEELDRLFALSKRSAQKGSIDLIVWPENAIARNMSADPNLKAYVQEQTKELNVPIISGALYNDKSGKQYNCAASITRNGLIASYYKKTKLFPFIESPYFSAGSDLSPLPLNNSDTRAGTMICFESLYPYISGKLAKNGADFLLLLSNDSIFGNSNWPILHSAYIVFRAVENGICGIHLNNNGRSLVVDGVGRTIIKTPLNKTVIATAAIQTGRR